MQVLEGAEKDVHEIYNSILIDPRNNANVVLVEEEIKHRDFPDWSMGFKSLENCSAEELPGFQNVFSGKLDKDVVVNNTSEALGLLMRYANRT